MWRKYLGAAVIGLSLAGITSAQPAADTTQPAAAVDMPDTTPPGKPHFDVRGSHVGEQVPDLTVYGLDGKPLSLSDAWAYGVPTLLITSSYTCPKSRSQYPQAADLARRLGGNKINLVIVYVIEAHPSGDPSPYLGREDVTPENQRDQILCRQPRTLADRLALASKFKIRLGVAGYIFVDAMDNAAWKALGGGPNMGVLVDDRGIVLARQGWFDELTMEKAARVFGEAMAAADRQERASEAPGFDEIADTQATVDGDLAKVEAQVAKSPDLVRKIFLYIPRVENGDRTLLHYAVEKDHVDIASFLIAKGADVNLQTIHAPSPLHLAAKVGDVAMVKLLIAHGADVNAIAPHHGPTPLQEALVYGHGDVAKALQDAGAKPNFFTEVAQGDTAAVQAQLAQDSSVAMRPDGSGRPPLVYATAGNQPAMAQLLCDTGSNPNLLCEAVTSGSLDVVRELIAHKADPNQPDIGGIPPLYIAAQQNQVEMTQALLDAGADVNAGRGPDMEPCGPPGPPDPDSALNWAASGGAAKAVVLLLQHGAKVDAPSAGQGTPLHSAASGDVTPDRLAAVAALVAAHADINEVDAAGNTPLDDALTSQKLAKLPNSPVVDYLRAHGGKEHAAPATGQ
jgi:ankyrin repeat protein